MPVSMNTKPEGLANHAMKSRSSAAPTARKSDRKMPGTRVGTMEDWRQGGGKKNRQGSPARPNQLRDGS